VVRKNGNTLTVTFGEALGVWRFCQLMGGDMSAESPATGGARFTVCLPAAVIDRPECVALPAA